MTKQPQECSANRVLADMVAAFEKEPKDTQSSSVVYDTDDDDGGPTTNPKVIQYRLWQWGVPLRFRSATLDDLPLAVRVEIRKWKDLPGTVLTLTGEVGTGKTYAAAAVLAERARITSAPASFVVVAELAAEMREAVSGGSTSQILKDLVQVPLLVLDDFGAERVTDWVLEWMYLLINGRYNAMKPTVVTSNRSLGYIASNVDARLASRMAEGVALQLSGGDRRLQRGGA